MNHKSIMKHSKAPGDCTRPVVCWEGPYATGGQLRWWRSGVHCHLPELKRHWFNSTPNFPNKDMLLTNKNHETSSIYNCPRIVLWKPNERTFPRLKKCPTIWTNLPWQGPHGARWLKGQDPKWRIRTGSTFQWCQWDGNSWAIKQYSIITYILQL